MIDRLIGSKLFTALYFVWFYGQVLVATMVIWWMILFVVFDDIKPDLPWYLSIPMVALGSFLGSAMAKLNLARVNRKLEKRGL